MQESYRLMCLTAPEVAQYDESIQILQTEVEARKAAGRAQEAELEGCNLPIFQQVQVSNPLCR